MKALQIIASLLLPGLGQLLQERWMAAGVHFLALYVAWCTVGFFVGLVLVPLLHICSAYDAATWKRGE